MTTPEQLRFAADIIETGHPFGYRVVDGPAGKKYSSPLDIIKDGNLLVPFLAEPPDGRKLYNPRNLTAEQVGVGYRLLLEGEPIPAEYEYWITADHRWVSGAGIKGFQKEGGLHATRRVSLSYPWPEVKKLGPQDIKPFTLIRRKGSTLWGMVTGVCTESVNTDEGQVTYEQLESQYEYCANARPGLDPKKYTWHSF